MDEREAIRRWVRTWQQAGPELAAVRRRDIREADNAEVIRSLEAAMNYATRTLPLRESSGMVEMQNHFAKLRR